MIRYIARRLLSSVGVVVFASVAVFVLLRVIPGDPAAIAAGEFASQERIEEVRRTFGLDRPLHEQYLLWIGQFASGDFGRSWRGGDLVVNEIGSRVAATVELAVVALTFGVGVGIPAGMLAAIRRGRVSDHVVTIVSLVGTAMPVFWIGLLLIMALAVGVPLFPLGSRSDATTQLLGPTGFLILDGLLHLNAGAVVDALAHLALPAITLGWYSLATVMRVTRSAMLEILALDYVRTARSKGLSERIVLGRHALRNALVPIVTVVGLSFGPLVGGAVLTETVFSWPGLGRYMVAVVHARDFPSIQAIVLLAAVAFTLINLVTDIAYAYVDPRIRHAM